MKSDNGTGSTEMVTAEKCRTWEVWRSLHEQSASEAKDLLLTFDASGKSSQTKQTGLGEWWMEVNIGRRYFHWELMYNSLNYIHLQRKCNMLPTSSARSGFDTNSTLMYATITVRLLGKFFYFPSQLKEVMDFFLFSFWREEIHFLIFPVIKRHTLTVLIGIFDGLVARPEGLRRQAALASCADVSLGKKVAIKARARSIGNASSLELFFLAWLYSKKPVCRMLLVLLFAPPPKNKIK